MGVLMLLNFRQTSSLFNVILTDITTASPVVQAHKSTCGLNGQTVAYMGENKAAFAEDTFDIDRCG